MQQSNYSKELAQKIKATPQEMDAWEALRREPGLMGRLARRGKHMKRSYVGGRRSFDKEEKSAGEKSESRSTMDKVGESLGVAGRNAAAAFGMGRADTRTQAQKDKAGRLGVSSANVGGGGQTEAQKAAAAAAAAAAAKAAAEKAAAAKKKADAAEKVKTDRTAKRKGYVEGVMKDAEGRVEGDEGYDESTGKLDTEGSLEGIRQDYQGLREEADYSGTREDLAGYQTEADRLKTEAAGKYTGYETDIAGQPDYASKVAGMAAAQATTGTKAQTDLAALAEGIDTSTTEGKQALKDAAGKMGIAAGDIEKYESNVAKFAQAGQTAATQAASGIQAAAGRGETAAGVGQAAITAAGGQGMTQAQQAQQAMGAASSKLGGMADTAMDTGALMKDRGIFAGQIEAKRKAAQQGKLGNLRRSMAASGASPAEIARAEAEASGGAQAGREDALAASMAAMQSGQSQLGQAAGLTSQQAQIAAQGGSLGLQGSGQGLQAAQAAGQMGMAGAGMGMQGAQSAGQMGMAGAGMGMQGAGQMAGMAGQRAALAGQQGAMGLQGAQLGLAGSAQRAQNIQAGAGQAMQGQQGAMQGYGAAQGLGIGKTQAAAGMYGQGLQAQTGLMNMGSSLANQQQMSQQNEITQRSNLTGSMAGMTEAQLQDVVAMQNAAQQKDLAERGLLAQSQATAANRPRGPSQSEQLMGLVKTGAMVKVAMACIPEGTKIDTPDGPVAIEEIKAGTKVDGYYGPETEVLQVHQYKEDPASHRFYHITFDNGGAVDCCDMHKISGKRAKDCKVGDIITANRITSITRYNGVRRSYDLLTEDRGYRISHIQINSMIEEMAEAIVKLNNKLAA